jgi:hypothetical protein
MSETTDILTGRVPEEQQIEVMQGDYASMVYQREGTAAYIAYVGSQLRELAAANQEVPQESDFLWFSHNSTVESDAPESGGDGEAVDPRFPGLFESYHASRHDSKYLKAEEEVSKLSDAKRADFYSYAYMRVTREQVADIHNRAAANNGGQSDELADGRIYEPAPVNAVEEASVHEGTPNVGDRTTRVFKLAGNGRHREPGVADRIREGLWAVNDRLGRLRGGFRKNSEPTESGESHEPMHRRVRNAVRTAPIAALARVTHGLPDVTERLGRRRNHRADRLVAVDERRITPLQAAVGGAALALLGVWFYNEAKYGGGSAHHVMAAAAGRSRATGANSDLNTFQQFHVGDQFHQASSIEPLTSNGSNQGLSQFQPQHVGNTLHHAAEGTLPAHVDINGAQSPWGWFAQPANGGSANAMPEIDKLVHEGQQMGLKLNLRQIPGTDASGGNLVELTYNGHTISTEYAARLLSEVQSAN